MTRRYEAADLFSQQDDLQNTDDTIEQVENANYPIDQHTRRPICRAFTEESFDLALLSPGHTNIRSMLLGAGRIRSHNQPIFTGDYGDVFMGIQMMRNNQG